MTQQRPVSHNFQPSGNARVLNRRDLNGPTYFDHCGRRVYMKQIAAETGIPLMTLYQRWHRGDRDERLTRPALPRKATRPVSIAQSIGGSHVDTPHR